MPSAANLPTWCVVPRLPVNAGRCGDLAFKVRGEERAEIVAAEGLALVVPQIGPKEVLEDSIAAHKLLHAKFKGQHCLPAFHPMCRRPATADE